MDIESTCMKIAKGPVGITGVTTNEQAVQIWASGHHLCIQVLTELEDLREKRLDEEKKNREGKEGFNLMQKTNRNFRQR